MIVKRQNNKREKGFTLLEYCAGAAAVMVLMFTAMNTLGGKVSNFLGSIGAKLDANQPGSN